MHSQVLEKVSGGSKVYKFADRNRLGEKIAVQIRKAKTDVGARRDDRPRYWLSVVVLVTDRKGNVQEKYNPQIKIRNNQRTVDRAWVLEPSVENVQRLLEQVERLAFGGQ